MSQPLLQLQFILAGQNRYAHVTGLRADTVNPQGLGMRQVCSEDRVRRAFADVDPKAWAAWQSGALQHTWAAALRWPWFLDLDVTIKPIYGKQEGAEVGYNPHKPGRPSHTYPTLFLRHLRWCWTWKCAPAKSTPPGTAATTSGGSRLGATIIRILTCRGVRPMAQPAA